jgi:hypothetical protein
MALFVNDIKVRIILLIIDFDRRSENYSISLFGALK